MDALHVIQVRQHYKVAPHLIDAVIAAGRKSTCDHEKHDLVQSGKTSGLSMCLPNFMYPSAFLGEISQLKNYVEKEKFLVHGQVALFCILQVKHTSSFISLHRLIISDLIPSFIS